MSTAPPTGASCAAASSAPRATASPRWSSSRAWPWRTTSSRPSASSAPGPARTSSSCPASPAAASRRTRWTSASSPTPWGSGWPAGPRTACSSGSPAAPVGPSSGTQVAAHAAARSLPNVRALVLASPTTAPRLRSLPRVLLAWRRNHELEPKSLDEQHTPERQRAGLRRVRHALKAHLDDALEDVVPEVRVPVLVLYGDQDRICTERWARQLSKLAPDGRFTTIPGAHSFVWTAPSAWSEPIEQLAREVS